MNQPAYNIDDEPISLADLKDTIPWWPFSAWSTARMARDGKLPCIKLGRRVFVTRSLLSEFLRANVVRPAT